MKLKKIDPALASSLLLPIALSGMVAGAAGCSEKKSADSAATVTAPAANVADAALAGKHACKGMNSCKGEGGCASGDNGCKGKNSCKGKGGCAVPITH